MYWRLYPLTHTTRCMDELGRGPANPNPNPNPSPNPTPNSYPGEFRSEFARLMKKLVPDAEIWQDKLEAEIAQP